MKTMTLSIPGADSRSASLHNKKKSVCETAATSSSARHSGTEHVNPIPHTGSIFLFSGFPNKAPLWPPVDIIG
ncbi:MAG: hypothetical protein PF904_04735 [Kiritimatiellae bacterium]|nr:hypothetical protein [Kiritimatiellia bacterium]